jgi:predicted Zn-dependent peptidase
MTRKGVLNNVQYIYENNPNAKTVSIIITIRYGSAFNEKSGLAHLLEHLVFKGTKRRPNTMDLMYELDSIGGIHNAYTSKTFTGYHIKLAHTYFEQGLDLLMDILKNPKFLFIDFKDFAEEFKQEKNIVQKELLSIKDNYSRYLNELLEKNIFPSPLDLIYSDDLDALDSITIDDTIKAYKEYYCAQNMIVSIYGNLNGYNMESMESILNKYLGDVRQGDKNTLIYSRDKPWNSIKNVELFKIANIQNANLSIAYKNIGYKDKKVYYMLELFSSIFCDITSSRLFQIIREREGLVYGIKSHNFCYDHLGYFAITTNTKSNNLTKVIKKIIAEIEKVKTFGLTEKELELAKKNYLGKLVISMENTMQIAEYNAYELFYHSDNFNEYPDIPKTIISITLKEINEYIKDLLNNPSILSVLKPNN